MNTHEKNYTKGKAARRKAHIEGSIARYLAELEEADSVESGPATPRIDRLTERLAALRGRLGELEELGRQLEAAPDGQLSLADPDARAMARCHARAGAHASDPDKGNTNSAFGNTNLEPRRISNLRYQMPDRRYLSPLH